MKKKQQPVKKATPPKKSVTVDTKSSDSNVTLNNHTGQPESKPANGNGQDISRPVVTQEVVTARFKAELTRLSYEIALQKLSDFKVTEDNIAEAQVKLKAARAFLTQFKTIHQTLKAPAWQECSYYDNAYNSLKKPLEEVIDKKASDLNRIATVQASKQAEADKETARIANIKADIDNTLLNKSQTIASAKTNEQLVAIEKELGSMKANKTRFQEFLPHFIARTAELTALIKSQKQAIKDLEELEAKKKAAEKKKDDATLIALEDQKEQLQAQIEENKVLVQEAMINQAIKLEQVEAAQPVYNTVTARRSTWEWEIADINLLAKKMPHLVTLQPDEEKIEELLKTKKADGSLNNKKEEQYFGIRFFLKEIF